MLMKSFVLLTLLAGSTALTPHLAPAPPAPVSCTMSNGQPRPFPCEFRIGLITLRGKNDELVGTLKPGSTTLKLPKSKAVSNPQNSAGESFTYHATLVFQRINTASFAPKPVPKGFPALGFYRVSTSTVSSPISPGELTTVKLLNVNQVVSPIGKKPVQVAFTLQLNYSKGANATLVAPVQYIQIANPITFTKFPNAINLYRDRAEAFMPFNVSVDMSK